MKSPLAFLFFFTIAACSSNLKSDNNQNIKLNDYWFQGLAELNSYELHQARYGEVHEGEAVLIFVTEDFSKKKNVKLDNPSNNPDDKLPVLKLNMTKKFYTGVYPYSMMLSAFTPYQTPQNGLTKLTATSQEWCGHTFTQLAQKGNKYSIDLYSYFESEGDQTLSIDQDFLEDEIWNLIRIEPDLLPQGKLKVIPGLLFQRLRHTEIKPLDGVAELKKGEKTSVYIFQIPELQRKLAITFENEVPHKIISWEEEQLSGFGANAQVLKTTAKLKKTLLLDYWSKHDRADSTYRKSLDLKLY